MISRKVKTIIILSAVIVLVFLSFYIFYILKINNMEKIIRQPAQAGRFYPIDPSELEEMINDFLGSSQKSAGLEIKGLIAPHAGYVFSGQIAAQAYGSILNRRVKTVVLIGNSHTDSLSGLAIDNSDIWLTPLGEVELDKDMIMELAQEDSIFIDRQIHQDDHILEVQLPMLQTVLKQGFKIVPIVFGNADYDYEFLAKVLAKVLKDDDLVVISTDMSHYPDYKSANEIDNETLRLIGAGNIENLDKHIEKTMKLGIKNESTLLCGADGVKTLMELANLKNWQAKVLDYANSGDVEFGDKNSVVGYGALAFLSDEVLNNEQKKKLLEVARRSVEYFVKTGSKLKNFDINDERLEKQEGVFVTLKKKGILRGCIGQITGSDNPLWQNVSDMAVEAAFRDSRFLPVTRTELGDIDYEISVLSIPKEIKDWQDIKIGVHGVIIGQGFNKGVFLPQVAHDTGWGLEKFLEELCSQKAGLDKECYKDKGVKIEVFTAQVFSEDDF